MLLSQANTFNSLQLHSLLPVLWTTVDRSKIQHTSNTYIIPESCKALCLPMAQQHVEFIQVHSVRKDALLKQAEKNGWLDDAQVFAH